MSKLSCDSKPDFRKEKMKKKKRLNPAKWMKMIGLNPFLISFVENNFFGSLKRIVNDLDLP